MLFHVEVSMVLESIGVGGELSLGFAKKFSIYDAEGP